MNYIFFLIDPFQLSFNCVRTLVRPVINHFFIALGAGCAAIATKLDD
jgi:hypothetical protein